jgi:hypothetical protein
MTPGPAEARVVWREAFRTRKSSVEVQNGAFDPELTKLESCSLSAIKGNGLMFV